MDYYNDWFIRFAPKTYRETRRKTTEDVEHAFEKTSNLMNIAPETLITSPEILPILRMSTAPPLARDRVIGLSDVPRNLVLSMENHRRVPRNLAREDLREQLQRVGLVFEKLVDRDLFPWLEPPRQPSKEERYRAATIVADRLCGAESDPIIRNAQERRQLAALKKWLEARGYIAYSGPAGLRPADLKPGTFAFRVNVPVKQGAANRIVKIPVDVAIRRKTKDAGPLPLLVEAKSAGDFTNVNKRRKEEATKYKQLIDTYGKENVEYVLFLCGYFDSGYLGYEGGEGIDWVWEHRVDDFEELGV